VESTVVRIELGSAHSVPHTSYRRLRTLFKWRIEELRIALATHHLTTKQLPHVSYFANQKNQTWLKIENAREDEAYVRYQRILRQIQYRGHPTAAALALKFAVKKIKRPPGTYEASIANLPTRSHRSDLRTRAASAEIALAAIESLALSEFADDIAKLIGDDVSSRLFACLVLLAAFQYNKPAPDFAVEHDGTPQAEASAELILKAKVDRFFAQPPPRLNSLATIKKNASGIAKHAAKLAELMKNVVESQVLIEAIQDRSVGEQEPPRLGNDSAPTKHRSSTGSAETRGGLFDWSCVQTQLTSLSESATKLSNSITLSHGPDKNLGMGYTPLLLVADAWSSSFGVAPKASEGSRFRKVVDYCLLLFSTKSVDIPAGLEFWAETQGFRDTFSNWDQLNPAIGSIVLDGRRIL
jgi:hypothetical protein